MITVDAHCGLSAASTTSSPMCMSPDMTSVYPGCSLSVPLRLVEGHLRQVAALDARAPGPRNPSDAAARSPRARCEAREVVERLVMRREVRCARFAVVDHRALGASGRCMPSASASVPAPRRTTPRSHPSRKACRRSSSPSAAAACMLAGSARRGSPPFAGGTRLRLVAAAASCSPTSRRGDVSRRGRRTGRRARTAGSPDVA